MAGEFWLYAARLGAVALALLSGWLLGRTPPDWRGDSEVAAGSGEGMPGYYSSPSVVGGMGCFAGSLAAAAAAVAALFLLHLGWPEVVTVDPRTGNSTAYHDFDQLSGAFWMLVGSWFIGWIASRLTDKGPVGPLE